MNIQAIQLIRFIVLIGFLGWFFSLLIKEKYKQSIIPLAFMIIGFFFMPVRNEIRGFSVFENATQREIPEKVSVEELSFDERQQNKLTKIRLESKEIENDVK